MKKFGFIPLFVLIVAGVAHADTLYVQSLKAKVMAEKSFQSKTMDVLNRGAEVNSLALEGGWYTVTVGGKQGFMHRLSLGESPPIDKVSIVGETAEQLEKSARRRASAVTSAAAARGLSDEDRKRLSQQGQADYRSLGRLEQMTGGISSREVDDFAQEGGRP